MRPVSELNEMLGGPLPIKRLVQIWASLPERERLGFTHSLDERLANQLMAAAVEATPSGASRNQQQRASTDEC